MRRPFALPAALLAATLIAAAAPGHARAQAGGGTAAPPEAPAPAPRSGEAPSGGAPTAGPGRPALRRIAGALVRRPKAVRGLVHARDAGREVVVEARAPGGRWTAVAAARATRTGTFGARWVPARPGRHELRARLRSRLGGTADPPVSTPVTVYRRDRATWYGPGFYGRRTACGQTLRPDTVGVAHRTLPCGTRVELFHRGRRLTVPVIDRGPYANRAVWDLTKTTADALGLDGVFHVGAAVVR